jgi:nucleotide-binding universal stress UspA family protein
MYKRIFVAYDASSCAVKALDEAIHLAKSQAATLCIAYVDDGAVVIHGGLDIHGYVDGLDQVTEQIHEQGEHLLDAAVAKAQAAGCDVIRQLVPAEHRRPAEAIADAAREWNADLIIVGTHGRRGFQRVLVGSVAENLVRIASASLMLVREGAATA